MSLPYDTQQPEMWKSVFVFLSLGLLFLWQLHIDALKRVQDM
jgi:hypothetical protein